ncbi:MAG: transposase [Actinobacteria bacterium]|nr:transposase [Actinomycetota bacterium]MBI3686237.1 transposase [Actinomycetota bacterium]
MPASYEELVALVAVQSAQLAEQAALIEAMRVELVALRRAAGRDSSNSSLPPSQDGPASRARAKPGGSAGSGDDSSDGSDAVGSPGRGVVKRKQGGQPGHRGRGLARVAEADRTDAVEPAVCSGCGGSLVGARGSVASNVQVFDLPVLAVTVTEYLIMRRVCACGCATTAELPVGVRGGPACYGPQVAAASTWLASQDVIGVERAAEMMSALLGVPVSTGYVSACLARLDAALSGAGFEEALKAALCEADVLGTDETPAPISTSGATTQAATTGADISNPHVFTVRTLHGYTGGGADLVWFGAAGTRTKKEITAFADTGQLHRDPGS